MNTQSPYFILPLRFILYSAFIALGCELMRFDAATSPLGAKFSEHSITEFAQSTILILLAGLYALLYIKAARQRIISFLLFALMAASFFREQDAVLDSCLYHGSWKLFSGLFLAWALWMIKSHWKTLKREIMEFSRSYACGLLIFSMLSLYVFSRLMGRKVFWQAVMGSAYLRDVKTASEECLELYGYLLLLIAAVEYALLVFSSSDKPVAPLKEPLSRFERWRGNVLSRGGILLLRISFRKKRSQNRFWR